MRAFPASWWVAGGWALDPFVGSGREHDDVEIEQVELPRSGFWARPDHDGPWQLQFLHSWQRRLRAAA